MVRAEERVETEFLAGPRDREQPAVVGALLRFGEDPEVHAPILNHAGGRGQPGASAATHSTWWVIGNASKARRPSSRQPSPPNTAMSRARSPGAPATYATRRRRPPGRGGRSSRSMTARPAPALGGSSTAISGPARPPPVSTVPPASRVAASP